MSVRDAQVVVVGAGPVGLMLAGELRLGGVDVIVLERRSRPSGESRGMAVHARTREIFDQRGLLGRFHDAPVRPSWHFGALPVPLDFSRLDSPHRDMMAVPQARTEGILAEWATELGVDICRGHQVAGLEQDEQGVTLHVRTAEGDGLRVRATWVVGCDGGRSLIREAAGFAFTETPATTDLLLADVEGVEPEQRPFTWTPLGFVAVLRIGPGRYRLFLHEHGDPPRPDAGPPSLEEICAVFERLTGEDVRGARPIWTSRFGDRAGQATRYRIGRVLLAGDAAHVHPPAGGQGLNLGVQDAVNLGWKLAGVVKGWAPDDLLDTYHGERHPTGMRVLENTHVQSRMMVGGPEEVGALRSLFDELLRLEETNRYLAGLVTALDVRYDVGGPDHPLVGVRLPHRELVAWRIVTSTTHLLRPAHGVLLDLADDPTLRRAAAGWAGRVDVVTARCQADDLAGLAAVLVRPDGHVAWVAPASGPGLEAALRRWFGAPDQAVAGPL